MDPCLAQLPAKTIIVELVEKEFDLLKRKTL